MTSEKFYPSTENVPGANVKQGKGVVASTVEKQLDSQKNGFSWISPMRVFSILPGKRG
jgi:hypothetical protein